MQTNSTALRQRDYIQTQSPKQISLGILRGLGTKDNTVFWVVNILVLLGIIMVFSASYVVTGRSARFGFDSFFFIKQHGLYALIGFVAMNLAATVNYRLLQGLSFPLYLGSLALLLVTFFFGVESHGASRWIDIPVLGQFQPSEVAKVALIFTLARVLSRNRRILDTWLGFLFCSAIVGTMMFFVGIGNLSTAIIIGIIGGGMIFVASPHIWRFIFAGVSAVVVMLGYLYYLANHASGQHFRGGRFLAWQDPFADMSNYGFQIVQSLYAIASGGLFGLGIGQSRQKTFLPEVHNDVIFSVIVEELGFVGAGIVLLLFGILIWRGLKIAMAAPDDFGALLATGIVLLIASQVIINVAVVTNSIPNTGIPMPFISYGGTALIICMGLIGILLNISSQTKIKN